MVFFIKLIVYIFLFKLYCLTADEIIQRFSRAELFLLEEKSISQWFKSFLAIKCLCLLDENVFALVR
jgi:hypothetical protein